MTRDACTENNGLWKYSELSLSITDLAEDAHEIGAEDLLYIRFRISPANQLAGDAGHKRTIGQPFRHHGHTIEIGAQSDVFRAGESDNVVNVIDDCSDVDVGNRQLAED